MNNNKFKNLNYRSKKSQQSKTALLIVQYFFFCSKWQKKRSVAEYYLDLIATMEFQCGNMLLLLYEIANGIKVKSKKCTAGI